MRRITIGVSETHGEANLSEAQEEKIMNLIERDSLLAADILHEAVLDLMELYEVAYRLAFPGTLAEENFFGIAAITPEMKAEIERQQREAAEQFAKIVSGKGQTRH